MKIAVVTPYHREPLDALERCHSSVVAQTSKCDHWLVADGYPRPEIDSWNATHIRLPQEHRDNGNTPRSIGAILCLNEGYEGIAFLDADNWYREDHIERMIHTVREAEASVAISGRVIVLANGMICPFEDEDIVRKTAADTSCFMFTRKAARLLPLWAMMPQSLSPICDRIMFASIQQAKLICGWTNQPTVFYESRWAAHYRALGLDPPSDVHHTDWDALGQNYDESEMLDRLGSDPLMGRRPTLAAMAPRILHAVRPD